LRTRRISQCAFIIGGTAQIGRAVADRLRGNGWYVTVSIEDIAPFPMI
jgi:NAD(P)-dependent dehydrogenase (short-subunit alcohol dehydrogenase family)